jgi:hypothetical protein
LSSEPRTSPIIPSYGESSLADLSSSIVAAVTGQGTGNVLGLPETSRVCLLIVDGLGLELLRAHQAAAPFLAELAFNARPLTAGAPSTTVTSLASLGTALPPAVHGMFGYKVAVPGTGRVLNGLHWPDDIDPVGWQPLPTIFERLTAVGVPTVHVAPAEYANSGLTRAALRGADYRGISALGAVAAQTCAALGEADRTLVVSYHGDLDGCGHQYGVSSPAWSNQLAHVDRLAEQIASGLPSGTTMYVTADHGMVDVGPDDRIDVDAEGTPLRDGVTLLAGEARFRHVYTQPGAAEDVLATWREVLGNRAWVSSREEAIKDGWFGPPGTGVADALVGRIGDVVAACTGPTALVATRTEVKESALSGMHGSLTPAEQIVPLLTFPARLSSGPAYWPGDRRQRRPPHHRAGTR